MASKVLYWHVIKVKQRSPSPAWHIGSVGTAWPFLRASWSRNSCSRWIYGDSASTCTVCIGIWINFMDEFALISTKACPLLIESTVLINVAISKQARAGAQTSCRRSMVGKGSSPTTAFNYGRIRLRNKGLGHRSRTSSSSIGHQRWSRISGE